jgi:hypothetical protein
MRWMWAIVVIVLAGCTFSINAAPSGGNPTVPDQAIVQALQTHDQQIQSLARSVQAMQKASAKPAAPPGEGFREAPEKQKKAKPGGPGTTQTPATPGPESKK